MFKPPEHSLAQIMNHFLWQVSIALHLRKGVMCNNYKEEEDEDRLH